MNRSSDHMPVVAVFEFEDMSMPMMSPWPQPTYGSKLLEMVTRVPMHVKATSLGVVVISAMLLVLHFRHMNL